MRLTGPMHPIVPMEPKASESIPEGDDWVAQIKWDGVRILTYCDGNETRLFNRKLRERTLHYPELTDLHSYCRAKSVILDGEVVALGSDGRPSFHEVMRRDGLRRLERVEAVQKSVPVFYMVFDILYLEGEWLTGRTFQDRTELLSKLVQPTAQVQLVDSHSNGKALFSVVIDHNLEGIVMKNLDSPYLVGEKSNIWVKVKNYQDVIAVVGGYTLNDSRIVNALLFGLYDGNGQFWYIGHSGTGRLSQDDWKSLTHALQPLTIQERPFVNKPERSAGAYWVRPALAAKVQFIEWTEGRSLRQPSIQAFVNVPPHECRFDFA